MEAKDCWSDKTRTESFNYLISIFLSVRTAPYLDIARMAIEEASRMNWEFVVILVLAIPVILFPAAFIWYLNAGGIYAALQQARKRRAARRSRRKDTMEEQS